MTTSEESAQDETKGMTGKRIALKTKKPPNFRRLVAPLPATNGILRAPGMSSENFVGQPTFLRGLGGRFASRRGENTFFGIYESEVSTHMEN